MLLCINSQWVAGHMTALVMLAVGEFRVLYWCRPMPACISGNKRWHPDGYLIWCPRTGFRPAHWVSKFFHFHAVFGKKNWKIIPIWELAHPPRKILDPPLACTQYISPVHHLPTFWQPARQTDPFHPMTLSETTQGNT